MKECRIVRGFQHPFHTLLLRKLIAMCDDFSVRPEKTTTDKKIPQVTGSITDRVNTFQGFLVGSLKNANKNRVPKL